jgi:hypothetical protein
MKVDFLKGGNESTRFVHERTFVALCVSARESKCNGNEAWASEDGMVL